MIVVTFKPGRLGNRLLIASHLIHAVRNKNKKHNIYFPYFDDYHSFFESTKRNLFSRYPSKKSMLNAGRWGRKFLYQFIYRTTLLIEKLNLPFIAIIDIDYNKKFDLSSNKFDQILKENKLIILKGFWFTSSLEDVSDKSQVTNFFKPSIKVINYVTKRKSQLNRDSYCLVGIHIRQKDYKLFLDGKYYFELAYYDQIMTSFSESISLSKPIQFLVTSDEKILRECFQENLKIEINNGNEVEDLIMLSECDYILAPPSSFSLWASLYGNTPLFFLQGSFEFSIQQFSVFPQRQFNDILFDDFIEIYNALPGTKKNK